jgi:hypothetical protein
MEQVVLRQFYSEYVGIPSGFSFQPVFRHFDLSSRVNAICHLQQYHQGT